MFDEDFIKTLPDDDIESIIMVADEFISKLSSVSEINDFVKVYAILNALCSNTTLDGETLEFSGDTNTDKDRVNKYVNRISNDAKQIQRSRDLKIEEEKFRSIREEIYEYEFSDSDYIKIQDQINNIRDLISESNVLSEGHQIRLLKRLEQFQGELHKRVSNLDRALGFLLDVSIIVKQTGEGAKPIADVAKEISKILTQVILVSQGLPPGELPLLLK